VFGAPVMICMIVFSLLSSNGKDPHVEIAAGLSLENLLYFLLCTPVQVNIPLKCTVTRFFMHVNSFPHCIAIHCIPHIALRYIALNCIALRCIDVSASTSDGCEVCGYASAHVNNITNISTCHFELPVRTPNLASCTSK
jgi:hypothetical protein